MNNRMEEQSRMLERRLAFIKDDEALSNENRDAILDFIDECAAEGLGPARQVKYISMLRSIAVRFTPKGFLLTKATEKELKQLVATINRSSSHAEATKVDFKKAIKKYYKVLNGRRSPEKTLFIKTSMSKPSQVTREDIFTAEEVDRIISQCRNIRDKAFFSVMHETAFRPAELLDCSIADVELTDDGDYIAVRGIKKTPDRRNMLVSSGHLLREWIRFHPAGGDPHHPIDPSAPLWIKLEQTSCKNCGVSMQQHRKRGCGAYDPVEIEQISYASVAKAIRRACVQAEIKNRKNTMYSLRHSRITEVAQFMSNQQLCRFAGWRPSSGQFEVYVHLTDNDVNSSIREHYGLERSTEAALINCRMCGARNPADSSECRKCLRPLSLKAQTEIEDLSEAVTIVAELREKGNLERALEMIGVRCSPSAQESSLNGSCWHPEPKRI